MLTPTSHFDANILLIEDYTFSQLTTAGLLELLGCNVTIAKTGIEALSLCTENQFDLIFMDLLMNDMDGFETTKAIRKLEKSNKKRSKKKNTPIVALTANNIDEDKEKCFRTGMNDYLNKPLSLESLHQMLQKHLPDKEQPVITTQQNPL